MRQTLYRVYFVTGQHEEVVSFNVESAIILAQAEQIKRGNRYEVDRIYILKHGTASTADAVWLERRIADSNCDYVQGYTRFVGEINA